MRKFELMEPKSLAEASAILANDSDARMVAGGTALLTIIKQGLLLPKSLVNLEESQRWRRDHIRSSPGPAHWRSGDDQ